MTRDVNIRIYCNDAFDVLNKVLEALNSAGIRVPVRMLSPFLSEKKR